MTNFLRYLMFTLLLLFLTHDAVSEEPNFSTSVNQFGFNLLKHIDASKSCMISPFSITTAMAVLNAGAEGKTKDEIDDAFGWRKMDVPQKFKDLMSSLESVEDFKLASANGLFLDNEFVVKESFLKTVKENFEASVNRLNFRNGDTTPAVDFINEWVENKTEDKIKDLLSELSNDVRAVIVNAIYFKAQWIKKFEVEFTRNDIFYVDDDYAVETEFMSQVEAHQYGVKDGLETVKLNYNVGDNRKIAMVIFKPTKRNSLKEIESSLLEYNFEKVKGILSSLSYTHINISVPKFTFETKINDLANTFQQHFGIKEVFGNADLSGITEEEDLRVSKIIHQSFIDVNENGTEAAAATAILIEKTSLKPDPIEVKINQPFLFLIYDETNDMVLFIGRMVVPKKDSLSKKFLHYSHNTSGNGGGNHSGTLVGNVLIVFTLIVISCFY